jgi:hypothetical protein
MGLSVCSCNLGIQPQVQRWGGRGLDGEITWGDALQLGWCLNLVGPQHMEYCGLYIREWASFSWTLNRILIHTRFFFVNLDIPPAFRYLIRREFLPDVG